MYAAAGGASLASRQARQRQRQKKNEQVLKQKKDKPHAPKQYHNYTDDAPILPKLSRVERGTLRPPALASPHSRRHSTSTSHLKEPQRCGRLRESPSISIPVQQRPSTPCTLIQTHNHVPPSIPLHHSSSLTSQLPQVFIPEDDKLERRCSFVRQVEEMEKCQEVGLLDRCNHICNFEIKDKWDNANFYTPLERDIFGSIDYPFSECSQGRAAWQERERGRRCSLSEEARQHRIKQTEAHHRWMKRNRIHDTSYGGGSDDEDFLGVYHQSAAANALLYVGLGTTAIGSVIFFVGTGEKGFKTLELRLIGPTLIACGLLCCLIRVLLCACPSTCLRKRKKSRIKDTCPHYPRRDVTTALLKPPPSIHSSNNNNKNKKVSIVPPNHSLPSTSTCEFKEFRKTSIEDNEENELKPNIPQIQLPSSDDGYSHNVNVNRNDSIIELQNLEFSYDIQSVSSNDSDSITVIETTKLTRVRESVNKDETCLSVVIERSDNNSDTEGKTSDENKQMHSGIVLSPLQLGQ